VREVALIVRDLGSRTAGGAILRNQALAAAMAPALVIETNAVRESVGCVSQCRECADAPADPYPWSRCRRALAAVRLTLRRRRPAGVLVSELQLHRYFRAALAAGIANVGLDMHNSEADAFTESAAAPDYVEAVRAVERQVSATARLVTFVSGLDERRATARYSPRATAVLPNAVRVPRSPGPMRRAAPDLLFLGHLGYPPNVDAALRLIEEIFPAVRADIGHATLTVAGRRPHPSLRARGCVQADPPATGPLLDGRVLVVPLRTGGGSRLKILEAFAARVPVISTAKGAEGLAARPGTHYLEAGDAPGSYARLVRELLDDPEADFRRREAAYELVRDRYSWESLRAPAQRAAEMLTGSGERLHQ